MSVSTEKFASVERFHGASGLIEFDRVAQLCYCHTSVKEIKNETGIVSLRIGLR